VVYLAPDGGAAFANRLCAYRIHHGITDAPFFAVGCPIDLLGKINTDDINKLEALVIKIEKQHDVEIGAIVVDTVSRAMPGGDENQPADMSRFIDNLGRIGGNGRLVVGIHHTPKGNATVLRGHSSLDGAADCELNINDGAIRVAKSRDGVGNETFGFRLHVVELGHDDDGDLVTSCVALATDDAPAKGRRTKLPDGATLALKALEKAIDETGEPLPKGRHYPSSRSTPGLQNGTYRGCPVETWRTYFYALKTGDRDTQKKAFQRAVDTLQAAEIVAVWADVVWLTGHGT
jgi:hypothetical protein